MAFHAASLPLTTGVCLSKNALGINYLSLFTTDAEDYIKVPTIGEGEGEGEGRGESGGNNNSNSCRGIQAIGLLEESPRRNVGRKEGKLGRGLGRLGIAGELAKIIDNWI